MILVIARKELRSLFMSPLAWIILAALQLAIGVMLVNRTDFYLETYPQLVGLPNAPGVTELVAAPVLLVLTRLLLLAVPLLAMGLIADERRNRTFTLLLSAPVKLSQIVLGKFLGLMIFIVIMFALYGLGPLSLLLGGRLDFGLLLGVVTGGVLLAAGFAAVSLYASSLTSHPVVAALLSFAFLIGLSIIGSKGTESLQEAPWSVFAPFFQVLAPIQNCEIFERGMFDTGALVCLLLLPAVFLLFTVRRLEALRLGA